MDQHRPNINDFHVSVGPHSHDLPVCREVTYTLSLINEQNEAVTREHTAVVYEGLLADRDQVPWLIAHALRELWNESESPER
jgi:hypothetical protein